jgi:hypothetical protein
MPVLIAIGVLLLVIYLISKYWVFILGVAAAGLLVWLLVKIADKHQIAEERRRAEEAEALRQRDEKAAAHRAQQKSYQVELIGINQGSLSMFEDIPKHLLNAEELLDLAERDFAEHVFAPFWDNIEHATLRLGNFDTNVTGINRNVARYGDLIKVY